MVVENSRLFKDYYLNLKTKIEERELEEFGRLTTDEERINFVSGIIPGDCRSLVEVSENEKDEKIAKELKDSGNKAFGKGDFNEALKLYTDSILTTPHGEDTAELALAIANRSAVLYHLQEYQLAINDVDVALSLNYPNDLRYKVLERKAKCLLALKRHDEALTEFKNTIRALDDCKLPTERKLKMQTDMQIMLGVITKPITKGGHLNALIAAPDTKKTEEHKEKLSSPKNKMYEAASEMVDIKEEPSTGRYATAAEDIPAGDTILIEKAFCSVLLPEYSRTNCQHCFKRSLNPYPCTDCKSVMYCSLGCRESAQSSYHKHECKVLQTLHRSGVSITVLMALRIISQQNLDYFLALKDKLSETREEVAKYKTSDYLNIYHLVRHENQRKRDDFFERTVMALFLLRCLIKGNYFPQNSNKGDKDELTGEEKFIGRLLLRHLQLLQFNAHEISELEMKPGRNVEDSKSVFIGGGLYTTLALFNHSCEPGIVRYFDGTKVIVRTVKPIKRGEIIAENYGPIYSQMKKKERQEKLQAQYWFKCECAPCEELWPTYEEIDKKVLRFRCDARKETGDRLNQCRNILSVPVDTPDFAIKCFVCGQITNLLKGLKFLQDTDSMYQQASRDTSRGNYQAALAIYLEILTMLHDTLAPPFRDYLLCQQSIRKCMLTFGNKYIKPS